MDTNQLEADVRHLLNFEFSHQGDAKVLEIDREWLIEFVAKQMEHAYKMGIKSVN